MKYNKPFDKTDADAPYIAGDPSVGLQGSIPPGAAFEGPQREIVNSILSVGLAVPSNSDIGQLSDAVRYMQVQFAQDIGTQNALKVVLDPAPIDWASIQPFFIFVHNTNSASNVTMEVVGLNGKVPVVKRNGDLPQAVDILSNSVLLCVYDGAKIRIMSMLASDLPAIPASGIIPTWTYNIQLITSLGGSNYNPVYTKSSTRIQTLLVLATGGGGAGGSSAGPVGLVGSGGESGATAFKFMDATAITNVNCVIGAGGVPSPSGAAIGSQAGSGGQTSFGSYAIAPGGLGGYNSVESGTPPGGTTGGTGTLILPGNPGGGPVCSIEGTNFGVRAGNGGNSIWGGAGIGVDANTPATFGPLYGKAASGFGSGGGGGDSGHVAAVSGGAGADGAIIVIELGLTTS